MRASKRKKRKTSCIVGGRRRKRSGKERLGNWTSVIGFVEKGGGIQGEIIYELVDKRKSGVRGSLNLNSKQKQARVVHTGF